MQEQHSREALEKVLSSLHGYLPPEDAEDRTSSFCWFADEKVRALLDSGAPLVLVYTGSNGHSNFGDILQNKNILDYWNRREGRTPLLLLPSFAASPPGRSEELKRWFRAEHIVFFAP